MMATTWMGVQQVAAYVGVSKETVYRYLESKTIPAHRVGKLWKFKTEEIDQWVTKGIKPPRTKETTVVAKKKKSK